MLFSKIVYGQIYDISIPENDTTSYNYADFRLWISDSTDTLRGIYWFMHPNNGDSRDIVTDLNYQTLASNKGFALMGAHIYNMNMNTGIGDAVISATDSMAVLSGHSELEFIPFFINGYSWGGQFAYHFTKWIPQRVLGFITQKGGYHDTTTSNMAIQVPGLMFVGQNDLDYRIENLTNIFLNHRSIGAKWSLAMEQDVGHSQVNDINFLNSFFNTVSDLRIPNDVNVFEPIVLNTLADTVGWLGNQNSLAIGSWECYDGNYDSSSWIPLRSNAELWQNFVSESTISDTSVCMQNLDSTFIFFTVGIHGEDETSDYTIATNDTDKINQCRSQLELSEENRNLHINGYLDSTDGGFNEPWNWHIIPNEWVLTEMSIGVCNGNSEEVEDDLDYWINEVGQLCNWGSYIKNEIIFDPTCDSNEVELWSECYSIENTTEINLSSSGISGNIPPAIGALHNLTSLELYNNELTGPIPSEIGNLINLNYLILSDNQIEGAIPEEIGNLTNLIRFSLSSNQLTGSIPSDIGNLTNLTYLQLGDNNLSGPIPEEIGNLNSLEILFLYQNDLEGSIPIEISNCINLETLALNANQISGEIPYEIGNLINLLDLQLNDNRIVGGIPESICELTNLSWSSSFIDWDYSYIYENQLCPTYPSCIEPYIGYQDTSNCNQLSMDDLKVALDYNLYNSYPNPFNPSTTINFDIGLEQLISLNIYDLNGQIIEKFPIESIKNGSNKILWKPTLVASGIYFIELLAKGYRSTQKLILLK